MATLVLTGTDLSRLITLVGFLDPNTYARDEAKVIILRCKEFSGTGGTIKVLADD